MDMPNKKLSIDNNKSIRRQMTRNLLCRVLASLVIESGKLDFGSSFLEDWIMLDLEAIFEECRRKIHQ